MNFRVRHITRYSYSDPVQLCRNEAFLLPRDTAHQVCLDSRLTIDPSSSDVHERRDFFGNRVSHFAIQSPHDYLSITAQSDVSVEVDPADYQRGHELSWEQVRLKLQSARDRQESSPYLYDSPLISCRAELAHYAVASFAAGCSIVEAVDDLMRRIYQEFSYRPGMTSVATPLAEVLEKRHGVCQDFAHVAIGCLRSIGLAARYVSGYIETIPPPGQEKLVGADASHAWFSVYVPTIGWLDFDPTNNQRPHQQHITVAWGRDFSDVSPLKGVALGGGHHEVSVSVDVTRLPDNGVRSRP
ncbi:MAG: transglutaminase family protein [Desulfuromonadaceae bacterium]|nr:transglutaminase family protein [Desulfuromonadaceae bacterium]